MASEVRQPRTRVLFAGLDLPGVLGIEVQSNNHYSADRFRVQFAASAVPHELLQVPGSVLEILVAVDEFWASLIVGAVDSASFDPVKGLFDVEGRDLSAKFIESQVDDTFANRTSSEIAQILAGRHGLAALVTPTRTAAGRYYQSEHDQVVLGSFSKATTEWDLLAFLAAREGFDIYMTGAALWFGPPQVDAVKVLQNSDCVSLRLEHCVGLARGMDVTVKSWGSKSAAATVVTASAAGSAPPLKRTLTRPNLTADEALALANRTIADLKRHEWTGHVVMPGELTMSSRSQVMIAGTSTMWDRLYAVTKITRQLDVRRGFSQSVDLQGL